MGGGDRLRLLEVAYRLAHVCELMREAANSLEPGHSLFRIAVEAEMRRVYELLDRARVSALMSVDPRSDATPPAPPPANLAPVPDDS